MTKHSRLDRATSITLPVLPIPFCWPTYVDLAAATADYRVRQQQRRVSAEQLAFWGGILFSFWTEKMDRLAASPLRRTITFVQSQGGGGATRSVDH